MPELLEDATVEAIRIRTKWENDDYICRGHILNGIFDSLFDVYMNDESAKELWDSFESKYMTEDFSSKKFIVSNFNNYKMVSSRPVMEQYNELLRILGQYTQHGLKMDEFISVSSIIDMLPPSWKDFKHTLKHDKDDLSLVQLGSYFRIKESLRAQDTDKGKGKKVGGPSMNMTEEGKNKNNKQNKGKKRDFKEHGSGLGTNKKPKLMQLHDGLISMLQLMFVKIVDGLRHMNQWKTDLSFTWNDSNPVYMSSSTVVNFLLWHARLRHVHYKRMLEMSKDELIPAIDGNPDKCTTSMLTKIIKQPFKSRTRKSVILELIHSDLCDFHATPSLGIIHETTAPYTPQQNGVAEWKNRALKEMINFMLSYSGLSEGFWGEAMLTACYLLNRVPIKRNKTTTYELWKNLREKGIDCIFVGYAEHSKAYRFYVIEPNDSISLNSIIESMDTIFNENYFSSIPRPKDIIPNVQESQMDDHTDDVPNETLEPQKDAAFWKEAVDDEIGSIMENNTWVISGLPPSCKPLGCKWIFKRKMKVDGTIDKFKARLVIQGFRKKEGIDYFDTYTPLARIAIIRLLLALAAIHNLVIHQIDVKTTFLNGDLDEEVYMKQPKRFVMPGNEHKVYKLVKSLYGLKQAPKQWHQKFDEVVLSSGFHLNQSDKCVYSKFDNFDKGVIICLYVDYMLLFGTDQNQVDKTKKFLSLRFLMKDMGEADFILGIKIKRENKRIVITQSHYIDKILKNFNREDCSPMSTPIDLVEKLKPNTGKLVD
nr:zinc finger, CCHC-type [Tanacetum cinerariifolium]